MKVCGIELKSSEARFIILEGTTTDYQIVPLQIKKIKFETSKVQADVQQFHSDIVHFLEEHQPEIVGIKERMTKGRFSGSAVSFKMEALFQLTDHEIQLVHSMSIKSKLKDLDLEGISELKKFQEEAFRVALYLLITNS